MSGPDKKNFCDPVRDPNFICPKYCFGVVWKFGQINFGPWTGSKFPTDHWTKYGPDQIKPAVRSSMFKGLSDTVFRQRLTHFLKILEIFKIPKCFGEPVKIPDFWSKTFSELEFVRNWHVKEWHAKDWRIFQVLSTIRMRQSLAEDCTNISLLFGLVVVGKNYSRIIESS